MVLPNQIVRRRPHPDARCPAGQKEKLLRPCNVAMLLVVAFGGSLLECQF